MSRPRGLSESSKTSYAISLKVLRLSKPGSSAQCALPKQSSGAGGRIDRRAALSCPPCDPDETFFLSPLVVLPPAFGTMYVGEVLCANICANNELSLSSKASTINNVRLTAEIQTPSQKDFTPLELESGTGETGNKVVSLHAGDTLQRILRFGLREEGNHTLAITVSYTEEQTATGNQSTGSGGNNSREKTFRKLYQFAAQQLLSVRTKIRLLRVGKGGHILEAQLENLGDQAIHLESVTVNPKAPFTSRGLNAWDRSGNCDDVQAARPKLQPGNIHQVAFLVEQGELSEQRDGSEPSQDNKDQRVTLGQISIEWRGAMGEKGSLNTGYLMGRKG